MSEKSKRICQRDWRDVRQAWIEHVPDFDEPGAPPESLLCDLPSLSERLDQVRQTHAIAFDDDMPGVREGVLHEGIYLLHKAVHILGASLLHVESGMCTWSLSSAYHSAYFGAKAILSLLGVSVVPTDERGHYLVDVWHREEKPKLKNRGPFILIYRSGKIEHGELWACFQRAIERTGNYDSVFERQCRDSLLALESDDFARQRNHLHYRTDVWTMDDLHECRQQERFGALSKGELDSSLDDFLVHLAFRIVHAGQTMLGQLASLSKPIEEEKALVDAWLRQPFARLYRDNAATIGQRPISA